MLPDDLLTPFHVAPDARQAELDARLAHWQGVLRLRDWDVKIRMKRARDMTGASIVQGHCSWVLPIKTALITLLDPIDYPTDTEWGQDTEKTIVHELLHLQFAPFDDFPAGSPHDIAVEQAIELIAAALIGLDRLRPITDPGPCAGPTPTWQCSTPFGITEGGI